MKLKIKKRNLPNNFLNHEPVSFSMSLIHDPLANDGHLSVVQFKASSNHPNAHHVPRFNGIHCHWTVNPRGIVHFARNVNDHGGWIGAGVRPNACLCHRFCNAIYNGALFRTAQHAVYVQIKPNVSGRKCANGIRSQTAGPGFNKALGNAPAIHVIGHRLPQMILHPAEIGYVREGNAQFAAKAGGMIQ